MRHLRKLAGSRIERVGCKAGLRAGCRGVKGRRNCRIMTTLTFSPWYLLVNSSKGIRSRDRGETSVVQSGGRMAECREGNNWGKECDKVGSKEQFIFSQHAR